MVSHQLLREERILVVTPHGKLQSADFEQLAKSVDPYIEERGGLAGLMIYVERFPGWEDFGALVSHLRFVRDHHRKVARIAAVTDDRIASFAPRIANHFVSAEVRHFPYGEREAALAWLRGADPG